MRRITAPGTGPFAYQTLVSPDARWLAYVDAGVPSTAGAQQVGICRPDGTDARRVLALQRSEAIAGWGSNSASLLLWDRNKLPAEVDRVDFASGRRRARSRSSPPIRSGFRVSKGCRSRRTRAPMCTTSPGSSRSCIWSKGFDEPALPRASLRALARAQSP
jgi:hypothetical protein